MYKVALSVAACLRADTHVDVAWPVWSDALPVDPGTDAVALTPGGGRVGSLLGGALDSQLTEHATHDHGRLLELTVADVDAAIAGLPHGGRVSCALTPAAALPPALWNGLQDRTPLCLVTERDGDELGTTILFTTDDIAEAPEDVAALFRQGVSAAAVHDDRVVTVLWPVPQLVVTGGGPIADALTDAAHLVGWQVIVEPDPQTASGLIASLAELDSVVVIGHDVEASSRCLAAALESRVGYVGALGSHRMQQQRADWLAYRGITDLDRVHGPAGFDIGARSPGEVAVAIVAEAIAAHRADS